MFSAVMLGILLLDGWGMLGVFTDRFGFRNVWEVWVYQVFYGLLYDLLATFFAHCFSFPDLPPLFSSTHVFPFKQPSR